MVNIIAYSPPQAIRFFHIKAQVEACFAIDANLSIVLITYYLSMGCYKRCPFHLNEEQPTT